jgi:hypothetical protein
VNEEEEEEEEEDKNFYSYSIWSSCGIHVLNTNYLAAFICL